MRQADKSAKGTKGTKRAKGATEAKGTKVAEGAKGANIANNVVGIENQEIASLRQSLEEVLEGLKFSLVELTVSKHRGSVQIRAVIYNGEAVGTDDCSKVHRAIMPRLELAFPQQDIYLEVSSPGINRLIKNNTEFQYYLGKNMRCYRTDISDWTAGILESADETGIVLTIKEGTNTAQALRLEFDTIAKAKLDC